MAADLDLLEATGTVSRQSLDDNTRELFERGIAAIEDGRVADALGFLREANALAPDHAQLRSVLGLAVAQADGNFPEARTLCEDAAKQEFFNPEVYLNLARVYLCFGFKNEGCRFLMRGQMIDPANAEIQQALDQLGARMDPVLRFLPRQHFINRWLGSARHTLTERQDTQVAA